MKILYDHDFFSAFGYSGITRYFYEISTRIAVMPGDGVSLFMGFHLNRYGLEKKKAAFDHFFGVRRPTLPGFGRLSRGLNRVGLNLFEKIARPDIYHQTYYQYMLPEFTGKRIVTVHDMTYELFPQFFPQNGSASIEKKRSVEQADGIIVVSDSTRRDLISLWDVPPEKIRTIYHGNSLSGVEAGPPLFEEPYILYVGQRIAHKNFEMLLRLYCESSWLNRDFALVCFGGSPFTPEEIALAQSHGVAHRLHQRSGSDADLASAYRHASTLVYPSLYEGFGLPVIEALGLGCPALLSQSSSLPEVGGSAALYFDPNDSRELAEGLKKILFDGDTQSRLRREGPGQARKFTWEACALETERFYREILDT